MTAQKQGGVARVEGRAEQSPPRDREEARRRIHETRDRMASTVDRIGEQIETKTEKLRRKADVITPVRERVRDRPLPMVGVAFAAGLVVGLLRGGGGSSEEAEPEREIVYVDPRPDYVESSSTGHHSFLHELRTVLLHQIGNALMAAIAGVVSARMSRHDEEREERHRNRPFMP